VDKPFQPYIPMNASTSTSNLLLNPSIEETNKVKEEEDHQHQHDKEKEDEARQGSTTTTTTMDENGVKVDKI